MGHSSCAGTSPGTTSEGTLSSYHGPRRAEHVPAVTPYIEPRRLLLIIPIKLIIWLQELPGCPHPFWSSIHLEHLSIAHSVDLHSENGYLQRRPATGAATAAASAAGIHHCYCSSTDRHRSLDRLSLPISHRFSRFRRSALHPT